MKHIDESVMGKAVRRIIQTGLNAESEWHGCHIASGGLEKGSIWGFYIKPRISGAGVIYKSSKCSPIFTDDSQFCRR